ncbi:MAG TPA: trehalase family glycosidase [Ktedonobacteraceae bacterium]|nr:trehalase family glycosidase [Ktedonobacteraceae bacterium]
MEQGSTTHDRVIQPAVSADIAIIRQHILQDYTGMFREAGGAFRYPFIVPGSQQYSDQMWDWDSWLSNIALRQILCELNDADAFAQAQPYERGCVLNYLSYGSHDGWVPVWFGRDSVVAHMKPVDFHLHNMHKPVLAQHAAFLTQQDGGDAEWLREGLYHLQAFLNNYKYHHRHECGLYFWQTDAGIGVDNDPSTYFRPPRSSGSIYLNCLMVKELEAMEYLCRQLDQEEIALSFRRDREHLLAALQEHCWDERDGFFYSVDLNLLPIDHTQTLHQGMPRDWPCLIQRLGVWSGFLALWAGVATPEQAERVVHEQYRDTRTFNAPFGVRTLSKMEKMYNVRASGNPSSWLGPIWGISNYMTFRGLVRYNFLDDAQELAEKTIRLFGRDLERFGALHEYYLPENGEPVLNRGFQNWNYLVLNMIAWLEGKEVVSEF